MSEEPTTGFTASETKFLVTMLKNSNSEITANWEIVAAELGYSSAGSARSRWNTIHRTKIGKNTSASPFGGVDKTTPNGKKGGPKQAATPGSESNETTPAKKRRGRKKKAATPVEETDEEDAKVKEEPEVDDPKAEEEGDNEEDLTFV